MGTDIPDSKMTTAAEYEAEIAKLREALSGLIMWAGKPMHNFPSWGTPEAQERNRQNHEKAIAEACAVMPEYWGSSPPEPNPDELKRSRAELN